MANINIKLTTKNIESQLDKILNSSEIRTKFINTVRPIISESINSAIETSRDYFRPLSQSDGEEIVGKLGVGKDGIPDYKKLNDAYKLLKIGASSASIKISSSKMNFAQVTFEINKDIFYNSFDTNYFNEKTGQTYPWMYFYLNGMPSNPDYVFISNTDPEFSDTNEINSRTGLGVMAKAIRIPKETFELAGQGESEAFAAIFKNITKNLSSGPIKGKINKTLAGVFNA